MGKQSRPPGLLRRLRHRITAAALIGSVGIVRRLPYGAVRPIGRMLGWLAYVGSPSRRRRTRSHIDAALGELSPAERRRVLHGTYASMGMVLMESLWAPSYDDARHGPLIQLEDPAALESMAAQAKAEKRGLLLITAHLGCWEMLASWLMRRTGLPFLTVASEPSIEALREPMRRHREASGARLAWRGEAGMALMRHLRGGGLAVILADHNLRGEGVAVPFFHAPAHSLLAPARLALASGAVVSTGFAYRQPGGRVMARVDPPFQLPKPSRDKQERQRQEVELTAQYVRRIELAIRRDPGQWLWMHRRWRDRGRDTLETLESIPPESTENRP